MSGEKSLVEVVFCGHALCWDRNERGNKLGGGEVAGEFLQNNGGDLSQFEKLSECPVEIAGLCSATVQKADYCLRACEEAPVVVLKTKTSVELVSAKSVQDLTEALRDFLKK